MHCKVSVTSLSVQLRCMNWLWHQEQNRKTKESKKEGRTHTGGWAYSTVDSLSLSLLVSIIFYFWETDNIRHLHFLKFSRPRPGLDRPWPEDCVRGRGRGRGLTSVLEDEAEDDFAASRPTTLIIRAPLQMGLLWVITAKNNSSTPIKMHWPN